MTNINNAALEFAKRIDRIANYAQRDLSPYSASIAFSEAYNSVYPIVQSIFSEEQGESILAEIPERVMSRDKLDRSKILEVIMLLLAVLQLIVSCLPNQNEQRIIEQNQRIIEQNNTMISQNSKIIEQLSGYKDLQELSDDLMNAVQVLVDEIDGRSEVVEDRPDFKVLIE